VGIAHPKLYNGGQCSPSRGAWVEQAFQPVPHRLEACATRAFSHPEPRTQNLKPRTRFFSHASRYPGTPQSPPGSSGWLGAGRRPLIPPFFKGGLGGIWGGAPRNIKEWPMDSAQQFFGP